MELDQLTHEMFSKHLNETFALDTETLTLSVELTEVTKLGKGQARDSFSLLFKASSDSPYLPQKRYSLEHETLGRITLFLVPVIGPGFYEATFT